MKRRAVVLLALMLVVASPLIGDNVTATQEDNHLDSVVYLDGVRYYVHVIEKGDTLYSLSRMYGVSDGEILSVNPDLKAGFNIGFALKIPYKDKTAEDEVTGDANIDGDGGSSEAVDINDEAIKIFEGTSRKESAKELEEQKKLAEKRLKKLFDQHVVVQGETLYAISRRYEIAVSMILSDNADLDPANLAIGQIVNIRKSEKGLSSEVDIVSELDNYRQLLNKVAPDGFIYHLVDHNDTLETIAEEFEMGVSDIVRLNNLPRGANVQEGTIILVRNLDYIEDDSSAGDADEEESLEKGDLVALSDDDTLEIALLLPLSIRDYALKPIVEFYQGFLLGLEDLKRDGRSVILNLFNTERDGETIENIISDPAFANSDLIVGPVYEELLPAVLEDAERRNVPVVSPLVNVESNDSRVLFQMAPNPENRYDKLDDLFGFEQHVTLIYGETNDSLYEHEVLDIMRRYNREIERYDYKYEHPSVISERERLAAERLKLAEDEAELFGVMLDFNALDSLVCEPSPSDLTPLISNGATSNLFFVLSDNQTEVDRILSALASAFTTQVAENRGRGVKASERFKFSVVANPAWRDYNNIDKTIYFRDRVYNFPSYIAGRDSEVVRVFDGRYVEEFSDFPTQYSYRGYDVAKIFGEGMFGDIEYNMAGQIYTPLQCGYKFERVDDHECWVNTNWVRVRYNLDFTIKIE